jgi:hypothetical protein
MDVRKSEIGPFSFYKGTLDCPAQVPDGVSDEIIEAMALCGCCSFDDGISTTPLNCRLREGTGNSAECTCHNSTIVYGTCLSKRNHGACPYGLKGDSE